ncbi:MAG TPA: hypothetical protein VJ725_10875 [Thermoanaerobaculia bacterium]|nr:hypothetical protein [Thermoanaerobaculia bacterium]
MRRRSAQLFLGLVVLGIFGPLVLTAIACGGDCCDGGHTCGAPTGGFSLCCLHSVSSLPDPALSGFELAEGATVAPHPERSVPPPDPRGILHVPKAS